jgi:hypothetical protein
MKKFNFSKFRISSAAKAKNAYPFKEDEFVILASDPTLTQFTAAKFSNPEDCYNTFQKLCREWESKADSRTKVEFPRGYFGVDEGDECLEYYGDIFVVYEFGKMVMIVEMENEEYE